MKDGIKDKVIMSTVAGVGTPVFGYGYALAKKSKNMNGSYLDFSPESREAAKMGMDLKAAGKLAGIVGAVSFVSLILSERLEKDKEEPKKSR